MNNSFQYSLDQRRYHTFQYDCITRYGRKAVKIPLNAGFTCPTRDGSLFTGGCTFCSSEGSGETVCLKSSSILDQYQAGWIRAQKKYANPFYAIPYFESYTNTYGSVARIQEFIQPFLSRKETAAVSLATRPDCLDTEKIEYLNSLSSDKDIWIELGLQTANDQTAEKIHRGYTLECMQSCMKELKQTPIRTCIHLINGLPGETAEMMLETAQTVSRMHPDAVKIHMLAILKNSILGNEYQKHSFPLLSLRQYVLITAEQIRRLDPEIIVERVTCDPPKNLLIAPAWTGDKKKTYNEINRLMQALNLYQGDLYEKETENRV